MSAIVNASAAVSATAAPAVQQTNERTKLASLLRTYSADLQKGQTPAQLQNLASQIQAAAKALGQNVALPKPQSLNSTSVNRSDNFYTDTGSASSATLNAVA